MVKDLRSHTLNRILLEGWRILLHELSLGFLIDVTVPFSSHQPSSAILYAVQWFVSFSITWHVFDGSGRGNIYDSFNLVRSRRLLLPLQEHVDTASFHQACIYINKPLPGKDLALTDHLQPQQYAQGSLLQIMMMGFDLVSSTFCMADPFWTPGRDTWTWGAQNIHDTAMRGIFSCSCAARQNRSWSIIKWHTR